MLFDLTDERRAAKTWLPESDKDVTEGRVIPDQQWRGKPNCVMHGAMNRVDPVERIYRCSQCGVGARYRRRTVWR